jgi:hypothetical protein
MFFSILKLETATTERYEIKNLGFKFLFRRTGLVMYGFID